VQVLGGRKISKLFKETVKDGLLSAIRVLATPVTFLVNHWLSRRNLFVLYRLSGSSLGDSIAMSSAVRCISDELQCKVILFVKQNDEIFLHNPAVSRLYCYARMNPHTRSFIKSFLHILSGSRVAIYGTTLPDPGSYLLTHRPHSVVLNTLHIPGLQWRNLTPLIVVTEEERAIVRVRYELSKTYAVIKPTGKTTVTTKKEWGLEHFQQVVNAMPHITWVQPGLADDPLLEGVIDARGGTTLRELFCLVAESRLVLTIEGLYNHIGAAFDVPSFVVLSGYFYPESFTYDSTVFISQESQVDCAPCFLDGYKNCPIAGKPCMAGITVERVVKTIEALLHSNQIHPTTTT